MSGARELRPENVRAVRLGHGANCSSLGSVVDTLFVGAAACGAILAAILAAMRDEQVRVLEPPPRAGHEEDEPGAGDEGGDP